jgi:glycosyltransferase involved in cell wall biosynthesis
MAALLKASKIVVLPILKASISASGSSTCLNAMLFKRCVIGTEGPGFSDVFEKGELVCVPPEDPGKLAQAIQDIWSNDDKRRNIAAAGNRYALEAGDLHALFQRLIDSVANCSRQHF